MSGQMTEQENLLAMVLAQRQWRDRVTVAAEPLQGRTCGCRDTFVAQVRRLLAVIGEAPGE